jgi:hypothetical protein
VNSLNKTAHLKTVQFVKRIIEDISTNNGQRINALEKINIHENGLVDKLYNPISSDKLPGIILLSDSGGGIPGAEGT